MVSIGNISGRGESWKNVPRRAKIRKSLKFYWILNLIIRKKLLNKAYKKMLKNCQEHKCPPSPKEYLWIKWHRCNEYLSYNEQISCVHTRIKLNFY